MGKRRKPTPDDMGKRRKPTPDDKVAVVNSVPGLAERVAQMIEDKPTVIEPVPMRLPGFIFMDFQLAVLRAIAKVWG